MGDGNRTNSGPQEVTGTEKGFVVGADRPGTPKDTAARKGGQLLGRPWPVHAGWKWDGFAWVLPW